MWGIARSSSLREICWDCDGRPEIQKDGKGGYRIVRDAAECIKKSGSRGQRSSFLYLKIWVPAAEGGC